MWRGPPQSATLPNGAPATGLPWHVEPEKPSKHWHFPVAPSQMPLPEHETMVEWGEAGAMPRWNQDGPVGQVPEPGNHVRKLISPGQSSSMQRTTELDGPARGQQARYS